jgi:hypothetical protein
MHMVGPGEHQQEGCAECAERQAGILGWLTGKGLFVLLAFVLLAGLALLVTRDKGAAPDDDDD